MLAEELGRLPLALEQAAAYASRQRLTLAGYSEVFGARRAELLARGQPLAYQGTVDFEQSGYVLHDTADPDVFIAEIDTVLESASGQRMTMSLVWIFRVRDGQIVAFAVRPFR